MDHLDHLPPLFTENVSSWRCQMMQLFAHHCISAKALLRLLRTLKSERSAATADLGYDGFEADLLLDFVDFELPKAAGPLNPWHK